MCVSVSGILEVKSLEGLQDFLIFLEGGGVEFIGV